MTTHIPGTLGGNYILIIKIFCNYFAWINLYVRFSKQKKKR